MSADLLSKRVFQSVAGVALALSAVAAWSAGETTQAVWKPIDTMFTYSGFTSYYSCDGLADRVRDLLRQVGARNLKVYGLGCSAPSGGPSVAPSVRIMGEIPIEATPEAIADVTKLHEQRVKDGATKTGSAIPDEFTATRHVVTLSNRRDVGIEAGDCELLEQVKGRLLPELGIKVIKSDLHCLPRQVDIGLKTVEVETLTPVNKAVAEAKPE
jgi:hypothetical protein